MRATKKHFYPKIAFFNFRCVLTENKGKVKTNPSTKLDGG